MKDWFRRLPIHSKLVALALLVTGLALGLAMLWLGVFDVWRYRANASEEVTALAGVLAENTAAAVTFEQPEAATEVLRSVRGRDVVVKACVFLPDGRLFAQFARGDGDACADRLPTQPVWSRLTGTAPITRNDRVRGTAYVERDLSDLSRRMTLTVIVGLCVFAAAATVAYTVARRLHGAIAGPISALSSFAQRFRSESDSEPPDLVTAPDEVGALNVAFRDMVARVRAANRDAQEALERERQANRLKDEFLAAVSHELRTPLNAMMGWGQVLGSTDPTPDTIRQAASSIVKNARAQTRVIEDLIDVSRISTGKMRLAIELVDLRMVVAMAADTMQPVADTKGVTLMREVPQSACHVMGDRDRLVQVLWNLLSNAVKFTRRDGLVTIALRLQGDAYQVGVRDTGAGIQPAFLPHVFERFRQADGSMTRGHGGLGLGLAIVKELTELHGGSVVAHSDGLGRGAEFTVCVPRAAVETSPVLAPRSVAEESLPSLAGVAVLAVDDNEEAVALAALVLRGAGAEVRTATSASDALNLWLQMRFDVLVCDLAMPNIGGLELLERVRAHDVQLGQVRPAIALSAYASESDRDRSVRAGFQAHLTKPFSEDDLVGAVARAVAGD